MAISLLDRVMRPRGMRRRARRELINLVGAETTDLLLSQAETTYHQITARTPQTRLGARHLLLMSSYCIALHQAMIDRSFEPGKADALLADIVFDSIRPVHEVLGGVGRLLYRSPLRRVQWLSRLSRTVYYTEPDWRIKTSRLMTASVSTSPDVSSLSSSSPWGGLMSECDLRSGPSDRCLSRRRLRKAGTLASGAPRCDFRYHIQSQRLRPRRREPASRT